jgi:hypothetical protein
MLDAIGALFDVVAELLRIAIEMTVAWWRRRRRREAEEG